MYPFIKTDKLLYVNNEYYRIWLNSVVFVLLLIVNANIVKPTGKKYLVDGKKVE